MATLNERKSLIESLKVNDGTQIAGRKEDAHKLLNQWKIENFGTTDVNVTPPRDALPRWAWPYIPRADATTSRDGMKISHHLGDHFQDKSIEDILQDIITNEVPLSPEDAERILGPDHENIINNFRQQQSLKIGSQQLAKTPSQQNATNMLKLIKDLEKQGRYIEAQQLYKEQFPRA